MSACYYYLVASLPELSFDRPAPLTPKAFLGVCSEHLPASGCALLARMDLNWREARPAKSGVLKTWFEHEQALRNELAELRASRLGWEVPAHPDSKSRDAGLGALAARVLQYPSPRRTEDELDHARWTFLESLEFGRYFDLDWLVVYALKLRLLERRAAFNRHRGLERLRAVVSMTQDPVRLACAGPPGEAT